MPCFPGPPGYVVNLSALTLRTATDSFWRWRPARPGKAAETVSSATLDEQLFDHQRDAPVRSKSCRHAARQVRSISTTSATAGDGGRSAGEAHGAGGRQ
jgi:hypothetical protein